MGSEMCIRDSHSKVHEVELERGAYHERWWWLRGDLQPTSPRRKKHSERCRCHCPCGHQYVEGRQASGLRSARAPEWKESSQSDPWSTLLKENRIKTNEAPYACNNDRIRSD